VSWSGPAYGLIARLVEERTGLHFPTNRHLEAEDGIRRAMGAAGQRDTAVYLELLRSGEARLDDLVAELTIGETYFFRDALQFEVLRREVLPDLAQRRGPGHVLRLWSAGCASGEEAYSLAIMLEQERLAAHARVLGTDISLRLLARAREGVYGDWSLRGAGAARARPYLRPVGDRYQVVETLRQRVAFQYLNLAVDRYPSLPNDLWGMDLVLCRNVLIYFDRETVRRVAGHLFETLADGGWLVTASTDPMLGGYADFEPVMTEAGVLYHRAAPGSVRRAPVRAARSARRALALHEPASPRRQEDAGAARPRIRERTSGSPGQAAAAAVRAELPAARASASEPAREGGSAAVRRVRDLASSAGAAAALAEVDAQLARQRLEPELHFLRAILLLALEQPAAAAAAARRAIYLDRRLAMAHFVLGSVLQREGDLDGARRAYRNARDLCRARPAEEAVPLSDGERAGRLGEAAAVQIALLGAGEEKL
jgi:chemotaxis protein methyltransferase CheR